MARNKYNAKSVKIDDFIFDSEIEGNMYLQLKEMKERGEILRFSLHPAFVLIDDFVYMGKKEKGASYKADFMVIHNDGEKEIIEIKGYVARDFPLRLKLFKQRYPWIKITVLAECPKIDLSHSVYGGFIELHTLTKLRAARKRAKTNAKKKAEQTKTGTSKGRKSKGI